MPCHTLPCVAMALIVASIVDWDKQENGWDVAVPAVVEFLGCCVLPHGLVPYRIVLHYVYRHSMNQTPFSRRIGLDWIGLRCIAQLKVVGVCVRVVYKDHQLAKCY